MHEGISEICASPPKIPLLNPEINNKISDSVLSRERLLVNSTIPVAKPVDFSTIKNNKTCEFHRFFMCNFSCSKCPNTPISYTTNVHQKHFHQLLLPFTNFYHLLPISHQLLPLSTKLCQLLPLLLTFGILFIKQKCFKLLLLFFHLLTCTNPPIQGVIVLGGGIILVGNCPAGNCPRW